MTISYGVNGNNSSFIYYSTFQMIEYSDFQGNEEFQDSINISLTSSWDMNKVELNFTDLEFRREIVDIETNDVGYYAVVNKFNSKALAVQINITEPTIIYAVYLYGEERDGPATTTNFTVQINGYDEGSNEPNGTIYGSTNTNMTNGFNWYVHNFDESISLSKGIYTLMLNGTEMGPSEGADYYWFYNDVNPNNENLIRWELNGGWNNISGSPFLYKLDQKIIRDLYPEDINMTAKLNGESYPILNGNNPGEGSLIENVQYSPYGNYIHIPLINNESKGVVFNLSYKIKLENELISSGYCTISENSDINWKITPEFFRTPSNYSVKFNFPAHWNNLTIYRNLGVYWEDITVNITIDSISNIMHFLNNTIIDGAEWRIEAISPPTHFSLNVPITTFQPLQELKFSIENPIPSNYTFVLVDPLDFEIYSESIVIPGDPNQFSYFLPSNSYAGVYNAYIFFFNGTHAGVQHQAFSINVPIDPNTVYIIIIAVFTVIFISAITGLTSYQLIKRYKSKRERYRQKIFNMYMDVFNLNYFMVLNKTSGLNVYELPLAGKEIDPTLVSGFLQAIRTFGIELTDAEDQSQTIRLEFQNSKILMAEFRQFRLIFIMKENPSQDFIDSIRLLSQDIDEIYGTFIAEFKGDRQHFTGIRELLERNLNISLIYPLKIVELGHTKLNPAEKSVITKARGLMKEKNLNYFYVSYFMADRKEFNIRTAEIILNLVLKKIFQPIV